MAHLRSTRSGFDNYTYWIAFIIFVSFIAYFLTSMIRLANAEDNRYNTATLQDYQEQEMYVKSQRLEHKDQSKADAGNVLDLE